MSGKKKKSREKDHALEAIVFLTAILNLVEALIELIGKLSE